jgi:FdrA protein
MIIKSQVKRNTYVDSITLMKVAAYVNGLPGVTNAAALMATDANLHLLQEVGLSPGEIQAGATDLLLVVSAHNEESAQVALRAAEEQLTTQKAATVPASGLTSGVAPEPRSLEEATRLLSSPGLAVISVPGPYAALESERALRRGLHVFLFSDNVPLAAEIALKRLARERGLLLMGPDCGTAMLNGVGLGFVNVVPRGPIGIVGASGTGIQQVMSLIAQQGSGISQVIGSGGRDLSAEVGAITTLEGLRLLQEDAETRVIVLISKPPAPAVAEQVIAAAAAAGKPAVVCFVGADQAQLKERYGARVTIAETLSEAAMLALQLATGTPARPVDEPPASIASQARPLPATRRRLVGLFAGGTLCDETMHLWSARLGPIFSNIPLQPGWQLTSGARPQGHCAIDFGADEYTRGRPHPMIDPSLRLKRLQEEAADPDVAVILLDIVLGHCAHPDPAAIYAPVIAEITQAPRPPAIVVVVCGTDGDPQILSLQVARLREAGAHVFTSNAAAAVHCITLLYEQEEKEKDGNA